MGTARVCHCILFLLLEIVTFKKKIGCLGMEHAIQHDYSFPFKSRCQRFLSPREINFLTEGNNLHVKKGSF